MARLQVKGKVGVTWAGWAEPGVRGRVVSGVELQSLPAKDPGALGETSDLLRPAQGGVVVSDPLGLSLSRKKTRRCTCCLFPGGQAAEITSREWGIGCRESHFQLPQLCISELCSVKPGDGEGSLEAFLGFTNVILSTSGSGSLLLSPKATHHHTQKIPTCTIFSVGDCEGRDPGWRGLWNAIVGVWEGAPQE